MTHPGPAVTAETLRTAGKVIAVHINYASRAAQRGRTPEQPSYFLKAGSSLSFSGSPVERPAGCELLGFEGEIALVIGTAARRVSAEEAWGHVRWVTAANDLGVYDLRYADKGSNLRSKSGDGFTPVGPGLIDASTVDPSVLRVRTWVNGEPVQDDTTGTLLFPFSQLIADLSQLLTLEPGDIILTGTPAGASVAVPGDVIEVEVDSPSTGASTGRLTTPVAEGTTPLATFGARPRVDDAQRAEAWGHPPAGGVPSGNTPIDGQPAGGTPDRSTQDGSTRDGDTPLQDGAPSSFMDPELKERLQSVSTATLSSQLRQRGLNNVSIDGLRSTRPDRRVAGVARTLRYVPNREDLFATHGGGFNAQKRVIDSLHDGEILVMDARGDTSCGTIGDILALRAQVNGAAAIITDGGVRDIEAVSALEMPTFCANAHPAVLGRRHIPWEVDATVACGGTTVQPGDVIVADADGIVVIPPHLAEELAADSVEQERQEEFVAEMVAQGHSVNGLYPMNAEWKERYGRWPGQP